MSDNSYKCPSCGKSIKEGVGFCPHCGEKQTNRLNAWEYLKNPYKILQVSEDAEQEVIDAAYRSLAKKYHPDVSQISNQNDKMQEINWARQILSNPAKLAEWKRKKTERDTVEHETTQPRKPPPSPPREPDNQNFSWDRKKTKKEGLHPTIIILLIILVPIVICICLTLYGEELSSFLSSGAPGPTQYHTRTPAPISYKTPTPEDIPCKYWTLLTHYDVNQQRCVYGRIVKMYLVTETNTQVYRFSNDVNTFLIWGKGYYFENTASGDCVAAIGPVRRNESFFYMNIEEIELYTYSGCP